MGPNPTDRGKPGTKGHLIPYARSAPLGPTFTVTIPYDSRILAATLYRLPRPTHRGLGLPRRRSKKLYENQDWDHIRSRREHRPHSTTPHISQCSAKAVNTWDAIVRSWNASDVIGMLPPPRHLLWTMAGCLPPRQTHLQITSQTGLFQFSK